MKSVVIAVALIAVVVHCGKLLDSAVYSTPAGLHTGSDALPRRQGLPHPCRRSPKPPAPYPARPALGLRTALRDRVLALAGGYYRAGCQHVVSKLTFARGSELLQELLATTLLATDRWCDGARPER